MSRHARRETQGEQDWEPESYPPPAGAAEPFPGRGYPPAGDEWGSGPAGAGPAGAGPRYAAGTGGHPGPGGHPEPSWPDSRGGPGPEPRPGRSHPADPYAWGPDPLGGDRAGGRPGPEPMAPERWAHQSWDEPSWVRPGEQAWPVQPVDGPAGAPESGDGPSWQVGPGGSGGFPPPSPAMPGPDHPSGPLSPLPDYDWSRPGSGPPPSAAGYGAGRADLAPRHSSGRGHDAERGYPGYEGYVDDPRDLDLDPQESGEYPATGDWYDDTGQQHAWADEHDGRDLLPGLNEGRKGRRGGGPPAGSAGRKRRRRGRVAILASLLVFVLIAGAGGAVIYHYYRTYIDPPDFSGPGTGSVVVQIQPGQSATAVGERLAALGVVASARAFSNAAKASPRGSALEPGFYQVHEHMKASLALALLLKPSSRVQLKVTIPEGFRLSQIIARLGQATGDPKGYQQAIAHPQNLGLPAFAHGRPEGYLFPATYEIQPHSTPTAVLQSMVKQFSLEATSLGLPAAAARAHESQAAVITVASIIEAEGKLPAQYAKIAEVIYNRLNAAPPVKLQLDTTVLYAMSLAHSKAAFSTSFPSPYNTYLHAGLPPGPIDSPGKTAIEAALHPAHGNLLYFLTINSATGQTLFFSTAPAFDAAVAKYGSTGTGTGTHKG
ncbi:MAG TPA: endolytic transglycosylase MltG [Streptosporangiaceae bacterium]|nr:endolytic transglycosylase MltG [Streptosporangiaceae bacterium]